MATSAFETVWEVQGEIGVLSLKSPPGNSIPEPEFVDTGVLEAWLADPALKAAIVTGLGGHFSVGADVARIGALVSDPAAMERSLRMGHGLLEVIRGSRVPVAAAVSGVCFGAGLEIALACHLRVCAQNSLFAFPECELGLMPGLGGTVHLPGLVGLGTALQLLMSGEVIDAARAQELRLVDRVVGKGEVMSSTRDLLVRLTASRPHHVIHAIMAALRNALVLPRELALQEEARLFCGLAVRSPLATGRESPA